MIRAIKAQAAQAEAQKREARLSPELQKQWRSNGGDSVNNEHGVKLDRNGYAPSIIPGHDERRCFLCGRNGAKRTVCGYIFVMRRAIRVTVVYTAA